MNRTTHFSETLTTRSAPRLHGQVWRTLAAIALVAGTMALATGATPQSQSSASGGTSGAEIEQMRAALDKWVETRRIISQEKRDWAIGRDMLKERIDLVKREIESIRKKITDAQGSITEADRKRAELVDENDRVKTAVGSLGEMIGALESRAHTVLARLPDPLRDRIKPLSQRIPNDPAATTLSLSERFLNVVGIINEINKFNREITLTSEVRALADGTSAEVTSMYVGLGAAYYVGAQNTIAGIGRSTATGWEWTPANDAAADIAHAIAILKNEQVAAFVPLPITLE